MCRISAIAVLVCAAAIPAFVVHAQQPRTVTVSSTNVDEVLQAVRSDLQNSRADVIAKNVTLSSEQDATFWPLFETYQREQNAIMDEQLRGIQRYIESFDSLDDPSALGLIDSHLDRNTRMVELRRKWPGGFQRTVET